METNMTPKLEAATANQDGMVTSAMNMNAMRLVVFMETNMTPKLEAAPANQDGMVPYAMKVSLKSILILSILGELKSSHTPPIHLVHFFMLCWLICYNLCLLTFV